MECPLDVIGGVALDLDLGSSLLGVETITDTSCHRPHVFLRIIN